MEKNHNNRTFQHKSVLHEELINSLNLNTGDTVIDCTCGGGGHTASLLEKVGPTGLVVGFDQDPDAIKHLGEKFSHEINSKRLKLIHSPFSNLLSHCEEMKILGGVSAIIADIGVSSYQLDEEQRGFSFMKSGPLDMRMNRSPHIPSAKDLLETISEQELANIIFQFGEEHRSRQIARAIIKARQEGPLTTTDQLSEIIKKASHYPPGKKHPATKTFQALRIFINQELEELQTLLNDALTTLKPTGRLGIISFHSLEDRLVKQSFQKSTGASRTPPRELAFSHEQLQEIMRPTGKIIKPFPIKPKKQEILNNKRARSAKLRVLEKI